MVAVLSERVTDDRSARIIQAHLTASGDEQKGAMQANVGAVERVHLIESDSAVPANNRANPIT